jgi:hypothetical protein
MYCKGCQGNLILSSAYTSRWSLIDVRNTPLRYTIDFDDTRITKSLAGRNSTNKSTCSNEQNNSVAKSSLKLTWTGDFYR